MNIQISKYKTVGENIKKKSLKEICVNAGTLKAKQQQQKNPTKQVRTLEPMTLIFPRNPEGPKCVVACLFSEFEAQSLKDARAVEVNLASSCHVP